MFIFHKGQIWTDSENDGFDISNQITKKGIVLEKYLADCPLFVSLLSDDYFAHKEMPSSSLGALLLRPNGKIYECSSSVLDRHNRYSVNIRPTSSTETKVALTTIAQTETAACLLRLDPDIEMQKLFDILDEIFPTAYSVSMRPLCPKRIEEILEGVELEPIYSVTVRRPPSKITQVNRLD